MEEKKDFFAEAENNENLAEANEEATENQTATESNDNAFENEAKAPSKKHIIQKPIIIAGVIVVCFVLVYFVLTAFFNSSIEGTWVLVQENSGATYDEATGEGVTYYTFDKDGKVTVSVGTITQTSTYTTSELEGTKYVESTNLFSGSYEISGNIFTGRTFTLTVEGVDKPYIFKSAAVKSPKLKVPEDFKPNDKLTGKWNMPDYGITYEFSDDGTAVVEMYGMITYKGVYSAGDDKIKLTYFADKETTIDIPYEFANDNILVMNGMGYYKLNDDGSLIATPDQL